MGNAGICDRCGGVRTVWTGSERVPCPDCRGTGRKGGLALWSRRRTLYYLLGDLLMERALVWDDRAVLRRRQRG